MTVKITETISGYAFEWADHNLTIEVRRVKAHTDGKVTGDIHLVFKGGKKKEPSFSFNFQASRSRSTLVKELNEKYSEWAYNPKEHKTTEGTWLSIIDELCLGVQEMLRQGEPVITISSEDTIKPLEYLLYPIIPLHQPTALFGDPGSGKSQTAGVIVMLITLPWYDNPLGLQTRETPSKALVLDWEADEEDSRRQFASLVKGMGIGPLDFNYRRCTMPLTRDLEAIQNHIENIKADCVIFDSTSLAAGGDLNNMQIAIDYMATLRRLKNITTISIAHTSKDKETKKKSILGSVLFEAGFRNIIEVRGQKEQNSLNIGLFHNKTNYSGDFKPMSFRIDYENNLPVFIAGQNAQSIPEFLQRMSVNQQILQLLRDGPLETEEIVERLDATRTSVDTALYRLKSKNRVVKTSKGSWGLMSVRLE